MADEEENTSKLMVRSKDLDYPEENPANPPKHPKEMPDDEKKDDLSEEDELLKETLETGVKRVVEPKSKEGVVALALTTLKKEIRSATSSMTSVPKPLKFLRPHYDSLKTTLEGWKKSNSNYKALADIMSVLAMTMGAEGERECLHFKMDGNTRELGEWGHEFVRALSGEISQEFSVRVEKEKPESTDDLIKMVEDIIPFQMKHNSEAEAVDLLLEVNQLPKLVSTPDLIDKNNYRRVCLYLTTFADYVIEFEDMAVIMNTAFDLYYRQKNYTDALRVAIKMNDMKKMKKCMKKAKQVSPMLHKQLAVILGSQRVFSYEDEDEDINNLISNSSLTDQFQTLARELNVEEVKTPEDVYKSSLSETASLMREAAQVESARQNLASTFVNAFVNVGFQKDSLMTKEGSSWLYKNKDHGMMSAAASLGMVLLWNMDEGLSQIDKFMYSSDDNIKAGSLLALGIVNCGVRDEVDPVLGLLSEFVEEEHPVNIRVGAALGLGLAYANSPKEELSDLLLPLLGESGDKSSMEVISIACLALGLIYAGSADGDVVTAILERLMEASDAELDQPVSRFMCVGLGFLFLGKQEGAEAILEAIQTVEHDVSKFAKVVIQTCAYAGSGNVLQVQKLLHICAEHLGDAKKVPGAEEKEGEEKEGEESKKKDYTFHQAAAVIGIALITMGESVGQAMAERTYQHLLQYGDMTVRRSVPLAMALSHVSDPDFGIMDVLSKLSHDADQETAMNAIMALGIMGIGTNNSRVAGLLRALATFYAKEPSPLFMVRIAQGLLHAGKGLITMSPFQSDRLLFSLPAVAGLLTVLYSCMDLKSTLLGKQHYLMYTLACAIRPRMMMAVNEDLEPVSINVRVGQAVETVGQAGRPKTITGFQTHATPVLLGHGDRAELASDEYEAMTKVLEGVVIVKKRPDAGETKEK